MEKFNLKKLEQLKRKGDDSYYLPDDTKVTLSESDAGLQEYKQLQNSHYNSNKTYYSDTTKLKASGAYFQRFPIGVHKEYDEEGHQISEVDYDSLFPFSLEDLAQKMQTEFNVNIMDVDQRIGVSRTLDPEPYYTIILTLSSELRGDSRVITIHGTTGALLADVIKKYEK